MSKPKMADAKPMVKELEPGQYYWCACGESKNQPFCDGTHNKAGLFSPISFTVDQKKTAALCMCKQTANPPYCDGTHNKL
jgi:CDGSH-type Zn-finger protein